LHNTASQFTIVGRRNVLLSIEFDKTDEDDLQCAVECASSALLQPRGAAVLDYTSQESTDSIPGHYVMHLLMEEAVNPVYRQSRVEDGSIGPLEIRVVRPGTFEALMDDAVSRGTSIAQYKVPRCVTPSPFFRPPSSCSTSASPHATSAPSCRTGHLHVNPKHEEMLIAQPSDL
ncbi:hypothetical protein EJB05_02181, partial [Eragrostis curvula]